MKKLILLLSAIFFSSPAFCNSVPEWDRDFEKILDGKRYTIYTRDLEFNNFPIKHRFNDNRYPWISEFHTSVDKYIKTIKLLDYLKDYDFIISLRHKGPTQENIMFGLRKDLVAELKKDPRILGVSVNPTPFESPSKKVVNEPKGDSIPEWDRNFDKLMYGDRYTIYTRDLEFNNFSLKYQENDKKHPWISEFHSYAENYNKSTKLINFLDHYDFVIAFRQRGGGREYVEFRLRKDMITELQNDKRILGISVDPTPFNKPVKKADRNFAKLLQDHDWHEMNFKSLKTGYPRWIYIARVNGTDSFQVKSWETYDFEDMLYTFDNGNVDYKYTDAKIVNPGFFDRYVMTFKCEDLVTKLTSDNNMISIN